jgi:two-component system, OmpR family, sensor histidine kinase KdpD
MHNTSTPSLPPDPRHYFYAALACATTTLLATPLLGVLDLANIVMLFLLTVLLIAITLGRGAAVLAATLSVLLFDVFFVPPRFSLAVSNLQYLVTFAVMLATGLLTANLAAGLKQRAEEARRREADTLSLYEVARELAGALTLEQVDAAVLACARRQADAVTVLLLPVADGPLRTFAERADCRCEALLAKIAADSGRPVHGSGNSEERCAALYLPLLVSQRVRGVLAAAIPGRLGALDGDGAALLSALASLTAIAVERLHYVEVAQQSQLETATERLRSSILSALSHDLRTPLTALVGLAESLFLIRPALPPAALETAQTLHEQAARLAGLVGNLLDMARLNAGQVTLRREWQPLDEVIGPAIKLLGGALAKHPVRVTLPPELPLLEFDAVLLERVFCNLLENAAKYSPAGTPIDITAELGEHAVSVSVCDRGCGLAAAPADDLFAMFVRGRTPGATPGSGLGLAICRAVVEAHGGHVTATNREGGGACLGFTLPRGEPPLIEEEAA